MSIPTAPRDSEIGFPLLPELAFSADGSKFAIGPACGGVDVWDIRSKFPLKASAEAPESDYHNWHTQCLQFSSGNLGKEVLVFATVCLMFIF